VLFAAQVSDGHGELLGDLALGHLLNVSVVQRLIDLAALGKGGVIGGGLEGLDGLDQDGLETGKAVDAAGHAQGGGERVVTQAVGLVQVIESLVQGRLECLRVEGHVRFVSFGMPGKHPQAEDASYITAILLDDRAEGKEAIALLCRVPHLGERGNHGSLPTGA